MNSRTNFMMHSCTVTHPNPNLHLLHFCDRMGTAPSKNHELMLMNVCCNISVQRCYEKDETHKKNIIIIILNIVMYK